MTFESSGSLGPFEQTKISVIHMATRIQEAIAIQQLLDNPTEENMEILSTFILSDPYFLVKEDLPN